MTIHAEHPFADPEPGRDPVRRLRARLGGAVTLWTTGEGSDRAGLTVSSVLLAPGEPAAVLGLVDPDSDLAEVMRQTGTGVVALLDWRHRDLADAFAGVAPAPGGPFRTQTFSTTPWGPLVEGAVGWLGVRVTGSDRSVGWSTLVEATVEHAEVRPSTGEDAVLVHRRGRYERPGAGR